MQRETATIEKAQLLGRLLLALLAFDIALISVRVLLYRPFFVQRDAPVFVLEPMVLLLIYAGIVFASISKPSVDRLTALRWGAVIGVITGAMWILNLALETFVDLSGLASILSTAPFLLGAFLLWGVVGETVGRRTGSVAMGTLASLWSAMLCVLIAITFGFVLTYTSLPRLEHILVADPDFLRSGWNDLRAFAIANSFDSAFSHLLGALLISIVVGIVGGLVGLHARPRLH